MCLSCAAALPPRGAEFPSLFLLPHVFFSLSPDWLCLTPSRTPTRVRVSPSRLVPVALFEFFFFFLSRCHSRLALLTSSVALPIYILPHLVATRTLVSLLSLPSCFSKFCLLQQHHKMKFLLLLNPLSANVMHTIQLLGCPNSQCLIFFCSMLALIS